MPYFEIFFPETLSYDLPKPSKPVILLAFPTLISLENASGGNLIN